MLFWDEKNQTMFACNNPWDNTAIMMRVFLVEGELAETSETTYAALNFNVTASRAGLIDLDGECKLHSTLFRLDMVGMRIKHLAQKNSTTTTASGKASKGDLSWQTYHKYTDIGELAYNWYKIIRHSDRWSTLEPYNPPTRPDGEIIRDRPDNAHPGIQESGETVEGELLPPVKVKADAVAIIEPDAYAVRVGQLHEAAQHHANASVLCAAIAGAVCHQKKKSVKHGEFLPWLGSLADEFNLSISTCQRYMALADEMAQRIKALPKAARDAFLLGEVEDGATKRPILQLLADLNPADLGCEQAAAVAEAVRDVTNDQTLRQLYFDWGIMKDRSANAVRTGGDMEVQAWLKEHYPKLAGTKLKDLPASIRAEFIAYRESRKPTDAQVLANEREHARRFWEHQRLCLTEIGLVGGEVPTWGLLTDQDLLQTMVLFERTAQQMKRVLNDRGAR